MSLLKTPLTRLAALELAAEALSPGAGAPGSLPLVIVRARIADALQRVDRTSREQNHQLVHDADMCAVCLEKAEDAENERRWERSQEDRAS